MTITKQVTTGKEAKAIISKVYDAETTGGLSKGGLTFVGEALFATAKKNEDGYEISVSSNYYVKSSLEEIINS